MLKAYFLIAISGLSVLPVALSAEEQTATWVNTYGVSGGLIDMPTAEVGPDGRLITTISHFGGTTKTNLSFQLPPRISGVFRYSGIKGLTAPGSGLSTYFDRSFDVHYQIFDEKTYRPALAVGLRDFLGTGLYTGEYVVGTKSVGPKLRLTGGLGWGRLGSHGSFAVMGSRPTQTLGSGGIPNYDRWFRGPVAGFAGINYNHNDRLGFSVEYSSDAYVREDRRIFDVKSPFNFGAKYKFNDTVQLSASYMYGSEFGLNISISIDPKSSPVIGGNDTAPQPVAVRASQSAQNLGWTNEAERQDQIKAALATALAREGIALEGTRIEGRSAELLIRNERFDIESQAVGRAMRIMTRVLPDSVETLKVTYSNQGIPAGSVTISRSDIEALEHAPATDILNRARFSADSSALSFDSLEGTYPRLTWGLGPIAKFSVFDPDSPVRADLLAQIEGQYHIAPGWVASGSFNYKLGGNLDGLSPNRGGFVAINPPHAVRSDARLYAVGRGPKIEHLTIAKYGRLGENLYGRMTFGYLECLTSAPAGQI